MDTTVLEDIGLSRAEIKVYLSLLEVGPATSGPIIRHSKLQSSVVHRTIKSLLQKGILTFVKVGKNREYQATDPENLLDFIENKKRRLGDLLPELRGMQAKNTGNYHTEMFLGKRSMFSALLNVIKDANPGELYLSFSLIEPHDDEQLVEFYQAYNRRRREKKLKVKVLVNNQVKPIYEKNYSVELLKQAHVRYTDFHFPQGVVIFRDSVTFVHWGTNPFAVKITSNEMATQFSTFFLEFYERENDAY